MTQEISDLACRQISATNTWNVPATSVPLAVQWIQPLFAAPGNANLEPYQTGAIRADDPFSLTLRRKGKQCGSADAINGGQLWDYQRQQDDRWNLTDRRFRQLNRGVSGVWAMAQAKAQMATSTSAIHGENRNRLAVGVGDCSSQAAISIGYTLDVTTPRGSPSAFSSGFPAADRTRPWAQPEPSAGNECQQRKEGDHISARALRGPCSWRQFIEILFVYNNLRLTKALEAGSISTVNQCRSRTDNPACSAYRCRSTTHANACHCPRSRQGMVDQPRRKGR